MEKLNPLSKPRPSKKGKPSQMAKKNNPRLGVKMLPIMLNKSHKNRESSNINSSCPRNWKI
jgi:hypothetical protein